MSEENLEKQLFWDDFAALGNEQEAWGQTIRPVNSYTTRSIGILACRHDDKRRGKGILRFEKVTDHTLPGQLIAEWEWSTAELGSPGSPTLLWRGLPPYEIEAGQEYRIAAYPLPGWELFDPEKGIWEPIQYGLNADWAAARGSSVYARGTAQRGHNYILGTGTWLDIPYDYTFTLATEEHIGFRLSVVIMPDEAEGKVEVSPQKGAYEPGETVTLTAIPAGNELFLGWAGDAAGTEPETTIVMDSDKTVLANFQVGGICDIPIVGEIICWIQAQLKALYDWLSSMFASIVDQITSGFLTVLNAVMAPITTAIDWLREKLSDVWTWITETIPGALEWLRTQVDNVWTWVSTEIPAAIDWVRERVDELFAEVADIAAAIVDQTKSILEAVARVLSSFFDPVCTELNSIFKSLAPDLELALEYNSPEARAFIISLWPRGTVLWDYVKSMARIIFYVPWTFADIVKNLWTGFVEGDWGPAMNQVSSDIADIKGAQESLPEFIKNEIADPILDAIKELWEKLGDIFQTAFTAIWDAIKTFFTEILPGWFQSLWEKIHAGLSWVWDKISGVADFFLDEIMKLIEGIGPLSPTAGLGTLKGVAKVGLALAGGLGLMTLAGHLVHPIHSLGLEHISAMVYDMTNYKVLIGAGMGVIAAASIRTPLTWYFNAALRPNIPSERDAAMMRSRQYIDKGTYSDLLSYRGYPDMWHDNLDLLTETRVGYFALAAVARNGVFDRELFHRDLRRAGYAEEMILLLLDMYEKTSGETVQGMMSGAAIKRFKEGFTTEEQFHAELTLLGYGDQQFPTFLAAAQLDYAYDYLNDLVAAYRDAVRKGHIGMDEYRESLLSLGMVPERVEGYVLKERARLKPDEPLTPLGPPKAEYETDAGKVKVDTIRRLRRKELITKSEEVAGLLELGVPVDYANAMADNDDARLAEKATEE